MQLLIDLKEQRGSTRSQFEESHPRCGNQIIKYQLCIDVQSEHNYVILSGVIQLHVSANLLDHYQVILTLQSNGVTL